MSKLSFLTTQTTRRQLLEYSGKSAIGAALFSTLSALPFTKKALAKEVNALNHSEYKHSACLVNCGSRCALRVRVDNGRICRWSRKNRLMMTSLVSIKYVHVCVVVPISIGFIIRTV